LTQVQATSSFINHSKCEVTDSMSFNPLRTAKPL